MINGIIFWVWYYRNIGRSFFELKEYSKAVEHLGTGLTKSINILGENHPCTASIKHEIATFFLKREDCPDYGKALEYTMGALNIREQILEVNHPDRAHSYKQMELIFEKLGDDQKASEYKKKYEEIRKATE